MTASKLKKRVYGLSSLCNKFWKGWGKDRKPSHCKRVSEYVLKELPGLPLIKRSRSLNWCIDWYLFNTSSTIHDDTSRTSWVEGFVTRIATKSVHMPE